MEIIKTQLGEILELKLRGRLDAYWADHVGKTIDNAIRAGSHRIELNFAEVDYLSSAGLRLLLKHYKELKAVQGSLSITQPSGGAYAILKMAGFAAMMVAAPSATAPASGQAEPRTLEKGNAIFQIFDHSPGSQLRCSLIGRPEKFFDGGFEEADCSTVSLPAGTFGLGLGAFGSSFQDCRERFGEFVAAAGTAASLPTDGSSVPDFVVTEEALVPELKVLYAVTGKGQFAQMLRFDAKPEPPGVIGLSNLIEAAMEIAGANAAGMVVLAESAGLVGAALRRSPGRADARSPLAFPGIRDWLSFTTERTNERNLVLIVGIAVREPLPEVAPFVRPLAMNPNTPSPKPSSPVVERVSEARVRENAIGPSSQGSSKRENSTSNGVHGHFHAAVFPYRPVQRGDLPLEKTIGGLMTADTAQTLLHLLADQREFEGLGQSELMRGACWIGPIADFQTAVKSATSGKAGGLE